MVIVLVFLVANAFVIDIVIEGSNEKIRPAEKDSEEGKEVKEDKEEKNEIKENKESNEGKDSNDFDTLLESIKLKGIRFDGFEKGVVHEEVKEDHAFFEIDGQKKVLIENETVFEKWNVEKIDADSVLLELENKKLYFKLFPVEKSLPNTSFKLQKYSK